MDDSRCLESLGAQVYNPIIQSKYPMTNYCSLTELSFGSWVKKKETKNKYRINRI